MAQTAALPVLSGETGLTRYLEEIRRFPMLEPQEEYMLAKRWREHGDRDAAHRLVTSHLRLVAKIAMGYRGYGLPISEVISEGNVGLMQAVKRFEPEKGFRLATYAMWWIKAAIQEYILRSWSLVKMGTTANQKKLFFNLRKAKSRISALDEGDMRPDQVKLIAKRLGVTEQDVIDMNRRLGGDASLNAPIREDGNSGEWMDWLVDDSASQESRLAESEQSENRHKALGAALTVLNDRERRIFEARRLADEPITLEELADEFGVSRERVRQIEVRAFEKVQKAVKSHITAMESIRRQRRRGRRRRGALKRSFVCAMPGLVPGICVLEIGECWLNGGGLLCRFCDKASDRIHHAGRQRQTGIRIGRAIRSPVVRGDHLQNMICVVKQNELRFRRRLLQAFGVSDAHLHVSLTLQNEHGFADGCDQLGGIVREHADQETLHLRAEQPLERRMHACDINALTGLKGVDGRCRLSENWRVRRI